MNRSTVALVLLASLAACADSTPVPVAPTPPPPAPPASAPAVVADPPPTTEGDVTIAYARGMQIVVKRTPGAEFVAGQLCIRGGVRNWTADNAGVENVALSVATSGGTRLLAKGPFSLKLAALGATIVGAAGLDYSTLNAKSPKASWDELFPIMVETFLAPALPQSEFDLVKQREMSERRHEMEDGDGRLTLLTRKAVFAGHPYANRAVGTVETVGALKLEDLATQLAKLRDTNRLVLVVVGDVDPSRVVEQARSAFASVPRGTYVESPMPPLHFTASKVSGDTFKLPTNYVESTFAGPGWGDKDYTAIWLGMHVLEERVFDEVRTKRNLSYGPYAGFQAGRAATMGLLFVTAVDPTTAMKVMFDEAHRLQTELVPAKELDGSKALFLSGYLQAHETVDGQAYFLGDAVLIGGDWHLAKTNIDRLRAATPEVVRDAAQRWLSNWQTAIVGDPTKLDPKVVGAQ